MINRRQFLNHLGVSTIGLAGVACSGAPAPGRYTAGDIALLAAQRKAEAHAAGKGPFGLQKYHGYRGLASLPWFDLDQYGKLICLDENIPLTIDMHAHFGMSVLFKPKLDLHKSTERVQHLLDCDANNPGCDLDLDIYINGNFTDDHLETLESTLIAQGLWGSDIVRTQTIPNLIDEMNAMRIEQAVVLPIKLGLPFGDDQSEMWRQEIAKTDYVSRLRAGFSVHPLDNDCLEQMTFHARSGLKLMKLHPTVQKFYPDDPKLMIVYEHARALGVSVFFHGGRAGIEPESSHRYAMPRHYRKALADFPEVNFILGHAGARDVDAMLELRLAHKNAWLGTHGQGVTKLDEIIDKTQGERILFGSDWPFYHIGSSLAKALIVTDSPQRRSIRSALLRDNAVEFLNRAV